MQRYTGDVIYHLLYRNRLNRADCYFLESALNLFRELYLDC